MRGARTNWLPLIFIFSCTFLLPIQYVKGEILEILPEIGAQDRTVGLYQDTVEQYSACLDALVEAAELGETRGVIVWLNTWLDANVINTKGATALGKAAFNGHTDTVEELAARGADVNLRDSNGATALMMAADKGHVSVVKLLLAKGADANIQDKGGRTASSLAADRGHKEIVQLVEATGSGAKGEMAPQIENSRMAAGDTPRKQESRTGQAQDQQSSDSTNNYQAEQNAEDQLVLKLKKQGIEKGRFRIPQILPRGGSSARMTVKGSKKETPFGTEQGASPIQLYPKDTVIFSFNSTSGGWGMLPTGNGSIWCFLGPYPFSIEGYTFEGDSSDPLTFLLLEKKGLIYLHGKGKVVTNEGKEIKLGL